MLGSEMGKLNLYLFIFFFLEEVILRITFAITEEIHQS